jgi:hypothetical protein
LTLDQQKRKIPNKVWGRLKQGNQKSLRFAVGNPFRGIGLLDQSGNLLHEWTTLSLNNLASYRIMCSNISNSEVAFTNELEQTVKIITVLSRTDTALTDLKENFKSLLYLDDVFDRGNQVAVKVKSGSKSFRFKIGMFSHSIYYTDETKNDLIFNLYKSEGILNLYALPLNCDLKQIEAYPVFYDNENYHMPNIKGVDSYVIVSENPWDAKNQYQLRPTFRTTSNSQIENTLNHNERIKNYHDALLASEYNSTEWKELLAYFKLCIQFDLPFSTFDQIRAVQRSGECAVKAFFYLALNSNEDSFSGTISLEMERDLGFSFFWARKETWQNYFSYWLERLGIGKLEKLSGIMTEYYDAVDLLVLIPYINGNNLDNQSISNSKIRNLRSCLNERIVDELPTVSPFVNSEYGIPIKDHNTVKFIINSAIAVAESISNADHLQMNLWGYSSNNARIRRSVRYAQKLCQETQEKYRKKNGSKDNNQNFFSDIIIRVFSQQN